MDTASKTRNIVSAFIDAIWNNAQFNKLDDYLHPDFVDYSLPPNLPPDKTGTIKWIEATGKSFIHNSVIEAQVTEGDKSMLKIKMDLKHIGLWRGIEPTGLDISAIGYRFFKVADGKIIEHWALLDGNAIENQLRDTAQGCKIQR